MHDFGFQLLAFLARCLALAVRLIVSIFFESIPEFLFHAKDSPLESFDRIFKCGKYNPDRSATSGKLKIGSRRNGPFSTPSGQLRAVVRNSIAVF